ncbi:hypothetical protein GOV05_03700 [Candidatus Woesearchaeota archaeon]|nr:hypothetical protein [Candidatus Woesearchaeota archaeon]
MKKTKKIITNLLIIIILSLGVYGASYKYALNGDIIVTVAEREIRYDQTNVLTDDWKWVYQSADNEYYTFDGTRVNNDGTLFVPTQTDMRIESQILGVQVHVSEQIPTYAVSPSAGAGISYSDFESDKIDNIQGGSVISKTDDYIYFVPDGQNYAYRMDVYPVDDKTYVSYTDNEGKTTYFEQQSTSYDILASDDILTAGDYSYIITSSSDGLATEIYDPKTKETISLSESSIEINGIQAFLVEDTWGGAPIAVCPDGSCYTNEHGVVLDSEGNYIAYIDEGVFGGDEVMPVGSDGLVDGKYILTPTGLVRVSGEPVGNKYYDSSGKLIGVKYEGKVYPLVNGYMIPDPSGEGYIGYYNEDQNAVITEKDINQNTIKIGNKEYQSITYNGREIGAIVNGQVLRKDGDTYVDSSGTVKAAKIGNEFGIVDGRGVVRGEDDKPLAIVQYECENCDDDDPTNDNLQANLETGSDALTVSNRFLSEWGSQAAIRRYQLEREQQDQTWGLFNLMAETVQTARTLGSLGAAFGWGDQEDPWLEGVSELADVFSPDAWAESECDYPFDYQTPTNVLITGDDDAALVIEGKRTNHSNYVTCEDITGADNDTMCEEAFEAFGKSEDVKCSDGLCVDKTNTNWDVPVEAQYYIYIIELIISAQDDIYYSDENDDLEFKLMLRPRSTRLDLNRDGVRNDSDTIKVKKGETIRLINQDQIAFFLPINATNTYDEVCVEFTQRPDKLGDLLKDYGGSSKNLFCTNFVIDREINPDNNNNLLLYEIGGISIPVTVMVLI